MTTEITTDPQATQSKLRYRDDPEAFAADILHITVWDKMSEFMWAVQQNQNTALKACFASSKTFTLAAICLWFLFTRPYSKVISSAPTRRQVRDLLWSEIATLHQNARPALGGNCLVERLHIRKQWFAVGFTANKNNESTFQGYHAKGGILFALDEATGVAPSIFGARDKIVVGADDRFVAIGNPTDANCEFARCFTDPTFKKLTITAYDTPNVKAGELVIPGMVTQEWVEDKERRWKGRVQQLWNSMVMAEFPEGADDAVIPLSWIEASFKRWEQFVESGEPVPEGLKTVGIDVASTGSDSTVFARRQGAFFEELESFSGKDTQEVAAMAQIEHNRGYFPSVDSIGIGAGVADALVQQDIPVHKVIGSERSERTDVTGSFGFTNIRSQLYWTLRERLDPAHPQALMLPRNEMLREELAAPTYKPVVGGKIQVEPKEKVKEKLGRSPDFSDAICYALAIEDAETGAVYSDPAFGKDNRYAMKANYRIGGN